MISLHVYNKIHSRLSGPYIQREGAIAPVCTPLATGLKPTNPWKLTNTFLTGMFVRYTIMTWVVPVTASAAHSFAF